MGWIIALIVGGIAGWLASMVMGRNASMGIFLNKRSALSCSFYATKRKTTYFQYVI